MTTLIDVPRGLKGVAAAETRIGDVRGGEGFYHYGAYNATRLARERSLEEAWFLVRTGRLPDARGARRVHAARSPRTASSPTTSLAALPTVARLASDEQPLEALRAAYELFALARRYRPWIDLDAGDARRAGARNRRGVRAGVVALDRLRPGDEPIAPETTSATPRTTST